MRVAFHLTSKDEESLIRVKEVLTNLCQDVNSKKIGKRFGKS